MVAWKSGFGYFVTFSFTGQRGESQVNGPDERQISHEPSRSPSRTKKSLGVARVAPPPYRYKTIAKGFGVREPELVFFWVPSSRSLGIQRWLMEIFFLRIKTERARSRPDGR